MAIIQSFSITPTARTAAPPSAGVVSVVDYIIDVKASDIAVNNILEMGIVPATFRVVDMVWRSTDLDTNGTPTLSLSVGAMSGRPGSKDNSRTVDTSYFASNVLGRAGGAIRMSDADAFFTSAVNEDRSIGIRVVAAAATAAATGKISLRVFLASE